MIIGISGKINSGKDLIGEIILYLTDKYYHSKVGKEASFENWKTSNIHSSGYNISHKAMYEVNNTSHFKIKKFADKLKDIVCILLGCTREQLEDREFKEKELGEEWYLYAVKNIYSNETISPYFLTREEAKHWEQTQDWYEDTGGYDTCATLIKPTPRFLLQSIGTNLFRNQLHPEIWVNSLMNEYKSKLSSNYPVDDLDWEPRFIYPNWIITDTRFPNEMKAVKKRGGITIRVNRDYVLTGGPEDPKEQHKSETALDKAEFDYVIDNNSTIEELIEKVRQILIKENLL